MTSFERGQLKNPGLQEGRSPHWILPRRRHRKSAGTGATNIRTCYLHRGNTAHVMILLDQAGAGTSSAIISPPSRAQQLFIDHFWAQESRSSSIGPSWRVIPDANPNLIFVVSRDARSIRIRCDLVGPRSRFTDVTMTNRIVTCGARLRPGALALLTRFPASDFTDRSVRVEDVFGARGRLLAEQLGESHSPITAISIISDFLNHQWTRQGHIPRLPLGHHPRVEDMARHAGLPTRTLRARLMQQVGLSPKRVLRIERLHRALASSQLLRCSLGTSGVELRVR